MHWGGGFHSEHPPPRGQRELCPARWPVVLGRRGSPGQALEWAGAGRGWGAAGEAAPRTEGSVSLDARGGAGWRGSRTPGLAGGEGEAGAGGCGCWRGGGWGSAAPHGAADGRSEESAAAGSLRAGFGSGWGSSNREGFPWGCTQASGLIRIPKYTLAWAGGSRCHPALPACPQPCLRREEPGPSQACNGGARGGPVAAKALPPPCQQWDGLSPAEPLLGPGTLCHIPGGAAVGAGGSCRPGGRRAAGLRSPAPPPSQAAIA